MHSLDIFAPHTAVDWHLHEDLVCGLGPAYGDTFRLAAAAADVEYQQRQQKTTCMLVTPTRIVRPVTVVICE